MDGFGESSAPGLAEHPAIPANGRRGTLCLTVDNLGMARAVGRRWAARPDPQEPGLRLGVPALLGLFADLGLRSTFFVEGWNALHHPDVLERIAVAGHEIGLHGWVHERWDEELDDRGREQLLWDGTAALRLAGFDPVAFRAPGGYRGGRTLEVLEELEYRIDSSIDRGGDSEASAGSAGSGGSGGSEGSKASKGSAGSAGSAGSEGSKASKGSAGSKGETLAVSVLPGGIVSIPWTWDMIDFCHYDGRPEGPSEPDRVADHWTRLVDAAAENGGLVTLIVHPFVTGVDGGRVAALRQVLEYALAHPGILVASAGKAAAMRPR